MGYYFSKIQGNESLAFATEIDIVKSVWRGIYFLGISIAYWFFLQTIKATKRAHQLKVKQLETEAGKAKLEIEMIKLQNAYLKAQIDPHFLFNTLSFIYNLIEDNSPKAARSIELLSDVMRYSLSEIGRDGKVELTKEIAQIKKYIELNQLRFNQKLHLIVNIKSYQFYENLRIPPLVLLSFVENIFQHGDLTKHTQPGILVLNFEDGTVHLHTENKRKNAISINSHHIGIQNVKSRLENFYKNSGYNLSINDKESKFIVDLKIKL
jgi:LytS/YehU family sensor histidine kinase